MHASQEEKEMKPSSSSWLVRRFFSSKSPPSPPLENGGDEAKATQKQRTPGGWKAMPFILGLSLSLIWTIYTHNPLIVF